MTRKSALLIFVGLLLCLAALTALFLIQSEPMVVINSSPITEEGDFLKAVTPEDISHGTSTPPKPIKGGTTTPPTAIPPVVTSKTFTDTFSIASDLEEASDLRTTANPYWWVNSGGWMYTYNGTAKTVQGDLSTSNRWYSEYKQSSNEDTDGGLHPQNIFRLVHTKKWLNFVQQAYFKINKINLSESSNRSESNGILLFNRYQNGDDLYYTGLRVDGTAIIKKKINGTYYTLAQKKVLSGKKYNKENNPNLLPLS